MFDCVAQDQFCLSEVIVHVGSYHADRSKNYNESNPGLGLIFKKPEDKFFLTFGGYRNSINRNSLYAGIGYELLAVGPFYARAELVAVSGYLVPLMVAPLPEVGVRFHGYGLALHYIPPLKLGDLEVSGVVSFSLTKRF